MNKTTKLLFLVSMGMTSVVSAAQFFPDNMNAAKSTQQQQSAPAPVAMSNKDYVANMVSGVARNVAATPSERAKAQNMGMTVEDLKLRNRTEYLKNQIKKQQQKLKAVKIVENFVKSDKKITLGENKYVDIYIPYNTLSNLEFDNAIKEVSFLSQPDVVIRQKQDNDKKLEILNKQVNLSINVKVTFINDKEVVFVIQTGDASSKRYIDYKIFTDNQSLVTKTLFVKPTRMKNIHNDFNNKAVYLILSRIDKNDFYRQLRENMYAINKVLYSGKSDIETLYGMNAVDYTLTLNNVYESPFLKSQEKNAKMKKRLILMEATIKNNSMSENLTVNESLIKNRFGNYVAFWLGDLDAKANVVSPNQELRFLLVIEEKIS